MGLLAEKLNNLDKIDKIIIATVFIVAAILSPVFADETLTFTYSQGFVNSSFVITEGSNTQRYAYIELEPGYRYTFTATGSNRRVGFSNSLDIGTQLVNTSNVQQDTSITFDVTSLNLKFFVGSTGSSDIGTITRVRLAGQESAISDLSTFVGTENIWDTFNFAVPYIVVVVVAVFGLYIMKRLLNGLSRGKGRI